MIVVCQVSSSFEAAAVQFKTCSAVAIAMDIYICHIISTLLFVGIATTTNVGAHFLFLSISFFYLCVVAQYFRTVY